MMGRYKNTITQNIINFAIVIGLIILSTGYCISILFPKLI